jgi:hypothetical protein
MNRLLFLLLAILFATNSSLTMLKKVEKQPNGSISKTDCN